MKRANLNAAIAAALMMSATGVRMPRPSLEYRRPTSEWEDRISDETKRRAEEKRERRAAKFREITARSVV